MSARAAKVIVVYFPRFPFMIANSNIFAQIVTHSQQLLMSPSALQAQTFERLITFANKSVLCFFAVLITTTFVLLNNYNLPVLRRRGMSQN